MVSHSSKKKNISSQSVKGWEKDNVREIFAFLKNIAANNNRDWFHEHHEDYEHTQQSMLSMVEALIKKMTTFDTEVGNVPPKSALFRIHRDVRFSHDKRPYKQHFGAYINPRGRNSMHGGYYLHLEPGNCLVAGGAWWFEPKVLREVRESIVLRLEEFQQIVEEPTFKGLFPVIGQDHLKTLPKGFPKDFPRPEYIRPKNYVVWHELPDDFFLKANWTDEVVHMFSIMKPFMDFVNETIDDYI